MAISPDIAEAILVRLGISPRTLRRRVASLRSAYGPLSADEARLIIAHEAGLSLDKYGVPADVQDRVRVLRTAGATARPIPRPKREEATTGLSEESSSTPVTRPPTPANQFDARNLHPTVVARSRKPFVNGLRQDAVLRAFRSVNNRVKSLTETSRDGAPLMTWAFSESAPRLRLSSLANQSERDEHNGTRFLMQGAMLAMRNPRAHEDSWPRDDDEDFALDCLTLASLLHRILDLCEARTASFRVTQSPT